MQAATEASGAQPLLNEMAHKLDRMMCVLFEYLEVALTGHGEHVSRMQRAEANAMLFALLLVCLAPNSVQVSNFKFSRLSSFQRSL